MDMTDRTGHSVEDQEEVDRLTGVFLDAAHDLPDDAEVGIRALLRDSRWARGALREAMIESRRLAVLAATYRERIVVLEHDIEIARAARNEAAELLREWAAWYTMHYDTGTGDPVEVEET